MRWVLLLSLGVLLPAPAPVHVAVYLAVPPGETLRADDLARAATIVQDALAFWQAHDPAHPSFVQDAPQIVTMPQPGTDGWLQEMPVRPAEGIAVWVYANHNPFYLLPTWSGWEAGGMAYGGNALIVLDQRRLPWSEAAAAAHELGHVRYRLPDWYLTDPTCARGLDLMCNPDAAYHANWLGCRSLAWLGGACTTTYLPMVNQ